LCTTTRCWTTSARRNHVEGNASVSLCAIHVCRVQQPLCTIRCSVDTQPVLALYICAHQRIRRIAHNGTLDNEWTANCAHRKCAQFRLIGQATEDRPEMLERKKARTDRERERESEAVIADAKQSSCGVNLLLAILRSLCETKDSQVSILH